MYFARGAALSILYLATLASSRFHDSKTSIRKEYTRTLREGALYDLRSRRTVDLSRYQCNNCLVDPTTGNPQKIRLLFIEGKDIVENEAAQRAASMRGTNHSCGSCCSDPERAVPECFVAQNWGTGWISKPLLEVLADTGAELVALTPANFTAEARNMAPERHPYSICPYEVVINNVDVCVGDFWETLESRNIVPFTTPLEINTFKLVTMAVSKEEFSPARLLDMFKPFSPGVWMMMIAMFLFMAVLMWVISEEESEEFDHTELFPHKRGLAKGIWVSTMGYLAGNQFTANKWSARLIVMGFSFFLATTVAAYTANLASFMVQQSRDVGKVTSLADIVANKKTLCTVGSVANMLTEPGIQERLYVEESAFIGSLFELLKAGSCDAALVGQMEFLLYVQAGTMQYDICTTKEDPNHMGGFFCVNPESQLTRYDLTECQCGTDAPRYDVAPANCPAECVAPNSKFCDIIEVLDPSLAASFNYALPAASWVEPFISSGVIASKISGSYYVDYKEQLIATNPPSCPTDTAQGRLNNAQLSSAISLRITFMSGTFFFSALVMAVGVLLHTGTRLNRRSFSRQASPQQPPPSQAPAPPFALERPEPPREGGEGPSAPAAIATTRVETFREGVDEVKAAAWALQAEQPGERAEERREGREGMAGMEGGFRLVQRELAAVRGELAALRAGQAAAREAWRGGGGGFGASSGRVPGSTFRQSQRAVRGGGSAGVVGIGGSAGVVGIGGSAGPAPGGSMVLHTPGGSAVLREEHHDAHQRHKTARRTRR